MGALRGASLQIRENEWFRVTDEQEDRPGTPSNSNRTSVFPAFWSQTDVALDSVPITGQRGQSHHRGEDTHVPSSVAGDIEEEQDVCAGDSPWRTVGGP